MNGAATASANPDKRNYALSITVGGSGDAAGDGARVQVTNAGTIATSGHNATGIFAQSVGGGGGIGGGGQSTGSDGSCSFSLALGGGGGASGGGGAVVVANSAAIRTLGSDAYGVFAQSVGGGGGMGGGARGESSSGNEDSEKGLLALGIGGGSGASGGGGAVEVTNNGGIDTSGYAAHAIFAQSVGGGGGVGGAGGASSEGRVNLGAGLGGDGGASGDGGTVLVDNAGTVVTRGHDAVGILAQSIGGGGGVGSAGNGESGGLKSVGLSVGGGASASGRGGAVTAIQVGNVTTVGDRAYGVFAQSVGGGGGVGGAGEGQNDILGNGGAVTVGGSAGSSGDGGAVAVTVTGAVRTAGDGAHGLFAQSIGGGGGIGGEATGGTFSVGVGLSGSSGGSGSGGSVEITNTGAIVTSGFRAHGILAQSIGGGGGIGGAAGGGVGTVSFAGSSGGSGGGGSIEIVQQGAITASGDGSHGIFAQSTGASGGDIRVTLGGGAVVGGSGDGAGLFVDGGSDNVLTIQADATLAALSGSAVRASGGDDRVVNAGTVQGNVDLGGGTNLFENRAGATFATGGSIAVATLTNAGTLSPGGRGVVATSMLTGNLAQSADGTLSVDAGFAANAIADLLVVSGTADLAGTVAINALELQPNASAVVLRADGTITDSGIAAQDTFVVDYEAAVIAGEDNDTLEVTVASVRFTPSGGQISANQRGVGGHLQAIWDTAAPTALAATIGHLANIAGASEYAAALDRLHPEPHLGTVATSISSGMAFAGQLLSCRGTEGPFAALREHECVWAEVGGGAADRETTSANLGYQDHSTDFRAGRQAMLAENWFLGLGAAYERSSIAFSNDADTDAQRFFVGATLKHQPGPWLFAAGLSLGYATADTVRPIGFPTAGLTATSNSEVRQAGALFRIAHLLEFGNFHLKPFADVTLTYLDVPGFTEEGAGALNLQVEGDDGFVATATPGIELGVAVPLQKDMVFRPFVSTGVTFFSDDDWDATATFQGAPDGVAPFTTSTPFPSPLARLSVGADILSTQGTVLRLQYETGIADNYRSHGGTARLSVRS